MTKRGQQRWRWAQTHYLIDDDPRTSQTGVACAIPDKRTNYVTRDRWMVTCISCRKIARITKAEIQTARRNQSAA